MRVLNLDDVRALVDGQARKYGTRKNWAELHGVCSNQMSNFMQGWCGPPRDALVALGLTWVVVPTADLPEGFDPAKGGKNRRKSRSKRVRIEDENPML